MQAKQMANALRQLAPVIEHSSASSAQVLLRLADALATAQQKPLASTVQKIEKQVGKDAGTHAPSTASELIQRFSKALQASNSATLSKDYAAVARLLNVLSGLPAQDVFERVTSALNAPARQSRAQSASQVDARAVADKLASAAADNEAFDAWVKELSKLQKPALSKIANLFLGYERAYKTKADVLKAIRARQLQDAIEGSRERRISKIAV